MPNHLERRVPLKSCGKLKLTHGSFGVAICGDGCAISLGGPRYNGDGRMPMVLRSGPYRFYFYSHEPNEPPHVHADCDDDAVKFWLEPVSLARNLGFSGHAFVFHATVAHAKIDFC